MTGYLAAFCSHAKMHFSLECDSEWAQEAAAGYLQAYDARSSAAQNHTRQAEIELNASPDRAVKWCHDLTGYTKQEAIPDGNAKLISLFQSFDNPYMRNSNNPWRGCQESTPLRKQALAVISATMCYVQQNMAFIDPAQQGNAIYTSQLRDDVILQARRYNDLKPKLEYSRPSYSPIANWPSY